MQAQRHFDSAADSATPVPSDSAARRGAYLIEVSGMNCRARIPLAMRWSQGEVRAVDGPQFGELTPIARRLHETDLDAGVVPQLNGSLTRRRVNELMEDLLEAMFPGLLRTRERHGRSLEATRAALEKIHERLSGCIGAAVSLEGGALLQPEWLDAKQIALNFLHDLPDIRRTLTEDARAAYEGDPAARSVCEVVLAYPGFLAIAAHRIANRLHALQVPLVPRMISEWAHTLTGIDIHPGATLGRRAFIDHGTGVVIGETAVIGDNVRLYHGVTLGAASTRGRSPNKRHPTVQDNVTLYAHATVLGGATVVGSHSVVGTAVVLADSVQEGASVTAERSNVVKLRTASAA
jgi:serine O-acetyltransferase